MNALELKIEKIIEPSLTGLGFALVRVKLTDGARRKLQIMAEPVAGGTVTLDECAKISRTVSALLDVADPIPDEYVLEVSSPGIDRPLIKLPDFERFKGFVAKVQLALPVDGRRKFQGELLGVEGNNVRIKLPDVAEAFALEFSNIESAKLVLTDELIKHSQSDQSRESRVEEKQEHATLDSNH